MQTINFNFFQLFILFGSIQGLIFSIIVFFVKKYKSKSGFFLGLTILFLSISNIQHVLIDVNFFNRTSIIRNLYIPWHWLVVPLFYVFIHYYLGKNTLTKKHWYYLTLPFLLITLLHLSQFIYQVHINQNHNITKYYEQGLFLYTNILSFLYTPVVFYFIYKMITTYESNHRKSIDKIRTEIFWLKNIVHIGLGILIIGMGCVVIVVQHNMPKSFYAYPFFISISFWIYWIGYVSINKISTRKNAQKSRPLKKVEKTGSTTFGNINTYIVEDKKYLVSDINLNIIAEKFSISHGYLSKLINEHTEKSFNNYINEFRVEASKKLLLDHTFDNYTIESIGLECGFQSKSNFYSTFKKFTGKTPNEYRKLNK